MPPSSHLALYLRSSKDEHGVSCDSQEHELRRLAEKRGETVTAVYRDFQLSSTKDRRPGFEALLADARVGKFDKVLTLNTSRIGRDQFLVAMAKRKLRKEYGVELEFAQLPLQDDVFGPFMERICEAVDELHRLMSADGSRRGQRANIRAGYRAGGRAPYGYQLAYEEKGTTRDGRPIRKSKLEPDPSTAPIVQEIFSRRAKGEARASICRDLEKRAVRPPNFACTGQTAWSESTIRGFEENALIYLGCLVYGKHAEGGRKKDVITEADQHPALIDQETASLLKPLRSFPKKRGSTEMSNGYALSGLLYCSECGAAFHGDRGTYVCPNRTRGGCENSGVGQKRIEGFLFQVLQEHVLPGWDAKEIHAAWRTKLERDLPKPADEKAIHQKLAEVRAKIRNLVQAISNGLDHEEIRLELDGLKTTESILLVQLSEGEVRRVDFKTISRGVEKIMTEFKELAQQSDLASRRRVFRTFYDRIELGPKQKKRGQPEEARAITLHTLFPLPNTVCRATPTGCAVTRVKYRAEMVSYGKLPWAKVRGWRRLSMKVD